MNTTSKMLAGVLTAALATSVHTTVSAQPGSEAVESTPLVLVQRIPLPSAYGRFDHMTRITDQNKLIVTGLGNSTVEVVDVGAR